MKFFTQLALVTLRLVAVTTFTGCAASKPQASASNPRPPNVTEVAPSQAGSAAATIRSINQQYKFAVIDFTSSAMPPLGTEFQVYRNGTRVGAIRITEPVRGPFATADILEGELQTGDEAR